MNELLIMQTQQLPVYTAKTPKTNPEGNADNTFEKLVEDALKNQALTKRPADDSEEDGKAEETMQGMMAFLPQMAADNTVEQTDMLPIATMPLVSPQDVARIVAVGEEQMQSYNVPVANIETVGAEPAIEIASTSETDAGMATGAGDGQKDNQIALAATPRETVEIKPVEANSDLLEVKAVENEADGDEQTRTVPITDFAVKSATNDMIDIKVGENYDVREPGFSENLTDTILYRAGDGIKEFEIELTPVELGKVKINVVFENGKASVTLVCANQKAEEILSSHVDNIRALIEGNTRNTTQVNIEREAYREQQESNNDDGRNQNHRQPQEQKRPRQQEVSIFIDQLKLGMMEPEMV